MCSTVALSFFAFVCILLRVVFRVVCMFVLGLCVCVLCIVSVCVFCVLLGGGGLQVGFVVDTSGGMHSI